MVDEFDVVARWIQDEGGVVAGVIGALSGAAVVCPARCRRGRVQSIDGFAVLGLNARWARPVGLPAAAGEFTLEMNSSSAQKKPGSFTADGDAQRAQHGFVESATRLEIVHHQLDVIVNLPRTMMGFSMRRCQGNRFDGPHKSGAAEPRDNPPRVPRGYGATERPSRR